jgi:glycosyltransferase involved in cell wall biosynthesis
LTPQATTESEDVRSKPITNALHGRIAVLIPCYNEEITVGTVVRQFRAELPGAEIYVFDNNSIDRTSEEARAAGAIVIREIRQGKGYVVQAMFQRVDADIYVMVDGDGTYDAAAVHALIQTVLNQEAEMVVGSRLHSRSKSEFKKLNRFGNRIFLGVLNSIFHVRLTDILSGYRVFSRDFVKNVPIFAGGFQIEAELTIKALERGYRIQEIPIDLNSRQRGSFSKIRHVHDGILILFMIASLFRDYKPLSFFGGSGLLLIAAGLFLGVPVIFEFLRTGLVLRLPRAVLAVGLVLSGVQTISVGLVLHTAARRFQELEYQLRSVSNGIVASVARFK